MSIIHVRVTVSSQQMKDASPQRNAVEFVFSPPSNKVQHRRQLNSMSVNIPNRSSKHSSQAPLDCISMLFHFIILMVDFCYKINDLWICLYRYRYETPAIYLQWLTSNWLQFAEANNGTTTQRRERKKKQSDYNENPATTRP